MGVFDRHREAVVKVEVSETGSGAKGIIGSGFFVGDGTRLVTNYHVVSRLVHKPARYVASVVDADDQEQEARLVGLDVLHDLALLEVGSAGPERLEIAAAAPAQGTRLYALGYPHDIGITIVEGTYNGRAEHSLYGRLHFTGSLNPGMSGGPAIDDSGVVVGVNVATAGNQVSFLVPLESVAELLAQGVGSAGSEESGNPFLEIVQRQLLEHQDTYHGDSLVASGKTVQLG
ncbi:MAG: trypsin-like peptidase domain-containing protein, partial [bacterium]|nr:trypsin-like peptidase domain-containing protein [bacterium]